MLNVVKNFNSAYTPTFKTTSSVRSISSNINPRADPSSNFYIYEKYTVPKRQIILETITDKFPLLKNFRPKYTKRENIDKKIIRKFKIYLKHQYKRKIIDFEETGIDKLFWIMFINGNIFPPMKFLDTTTNELVEFKSCNSNYLVWIFSKNSASVFYRQFVLYKFNDTFQEIKLDYNIKDPNELAQLDYYIKNMDNVFLNSKIINEIDYNKYNNQSTKVNTIYGDENNNPNYVASFKNEDYEHVNDNNDSNKIVNYFQQDIEKQKNKELERYLI